MLLFPRNVFFLGGGGWTVALRKQVPRWVHVVFMSRCVTDQIESTHWRKRTALMDGSTQRCSEENVPVSSPNVTALSNFRDCVTRTVIDRLSRLLHLLFYGWPSERSRPQWNIVSLELCLHTLNLSWSCREGLRRVLAQRVCLFSECLSVLQNGFAVFVCSQSFINSASM